MKVSGVNTFSQFIQYMAVLCEMSICNKEFFIKHPRDICVLFGWKHIAGRHKKMSYRVAFFKLKHNGKLALPEIHSLCDVKYVLLQDQERFKVQQFIKKKKQKEH